MDNKDKIREELERDVVPRSLEPDMIKKMLEEKAPSKKRSGIKLASRITATAAAAAIVCTGAAYFGSKTGDIKIESLVSSEEEKLPSGTLPAPSGSANYMTGAKDYSGVYRLISSRRQYLEEHKDDYLNYGVGEVNGKDIMDTPTIGAAAPGAATAPTNTGTDNGDYHDTYNQEEGIIESDIAKTDGKNIYYADTNSSKIKIAETDNGRFVKTTVIDAAKDADYKDAENWHVENMYVYDDMLIVLGQSTVFFDGAREEIDGIDNGFFVPTKVTAVTYTLFYTLGTSPELIDTYTQDGAFVDVRITADGYMYLVTNYDTDDVSHIDDPDDVETYIPKLGMKTDRELIAADCILLPSEDTDSYSRTLGFTVVGSIDLTESAKPRTADSKALAGWAGNVYCSAKNLYCVSGWNDSEITRISLEGGKISSAASGKVEGFVHDQFSMSERDGYFRIAVTKDSRVVVSNSYGTDLNAGRRENFVYVLDMDMNVVGKTEAFGCEEIIRSVNFQGNMAYVVTFRQTDPLFAIDLSDPKSPTILSELKVSGFSSYMQPWRGDLLLGFGSEADTEGRVSGVKLEMFDNSDPNNVREAGKYLVSSNVYDQFSDAVWDRKQLLIDPEKNLICVPLSSHPVHEFDKLRSGYVIFSYEDGSFIQKGYIADYVSDYGCIFDRAVYIGTSVYFLSDGMFISANMYTADRQDTVTFA